METNGRNLCVSQSSTKRNVCSDNATTKSILLWSLIVELIGQIADLSQNNLLIAGSLLIVAVRSFFYSERQLLPYILMLIPANRLLTLGPISAPAVVIIVYIIKIVLKKGYICKKEVLIYGALLLTSVSIGIGLNGSFGDIFSAIKVLMTIMVFYDAMVIYRKEWTPLELNRFLAAGAVLASILQLVLNPASLIEYGRFTVADQGGQNVLAIVCAFSGSLLLMNCVIENRSVFDMLLFFGVSGIGLLTGSRSFLIGMAIGIALTLVYILSRFPIKGLVFTVCFLVVGLLLVTQVDWIMDAIGNVLERVIHPKNNDITNGRLDLWTQYIDVFKSNTDILLFGMADYSQFGIDFVAHNFLLEQIAEYGIIGNIILLLLYLTVIKAIVNTPKGLGKLTPIVVLLGCSCFSHTLLGIPQTAMLFIGFAFLNAPAEKD